MRTVAVLTLEIKSKKREITEMLAWSKYIKMTEYGYGIKNNIICLRKDIDIYHEWQRLG